MSAAESLTSAYEAAPALWNESHFADQLVDLGEPQILDLLVAFQRYLADTRNALIAARRCPSLAATVRHDLAPISEFLGFELLADVCRSASAETLTIPERWNELYDLIALVECQCQLRLQRHA